VDATRSDQTVEITVRRFGKLFDLAIHPLDRRAPRAGGS
jgi:hypothetical protein